MTTSTDERRRFGRYYTPAPLVHALYRLVGDALANAGLSPDGCALADPSCGEGAFLCAGQAARFGARLGLDIDGKALAAARARAPEATLVRGDAYGDGLESLCQSVRAGRKPVVVIGNPPYVANSELLKSGRYQAVRDALLPFAREVPSVTSLRDDYVLFFGVADRLVGAAGGRGAVAFVTSATFVDNFLYAPLRRWLLSRYRLHALVELGPGMFEGTRVATALSVWVRDERGQANGAFLHRRLSGDRDARLAQLEGALDLLPARPYAEGLLLNAPPPRAASEAAAMRARGAPVGAIFRVSFPGLKTRFEELLVDQDGGRLLSRMREFFASGDAEAFAARHAISARAMGKLREAFSARPRTRLDEAAVRPFARFAGPRHRFKVARDAMAWAYVDPQLIPRGDHRLHGSYDPHRLGPKLVYNARELPLVSAVVAGPACVHDWRHSRFAPLWAPERVVAEGLSAGARPGTLGKPVLNLAPAWAEATARLSEPADLLFYLCAVINSELVQDRFAPLLGASEEVPVPLPAAGSSSLAQKIADAARSVPAGGALPSSAQSEVRQMFGL